MCVDVTTLSLSYPVTIGELLEVLLHEQEAEKEVTLTVSVMSMKTLGGNSYTIVLILSHNCCSGPTKTTSQ